MKNYDWETWFAWYPVRDSFSGELVWLQSIQRQRIYEDSEAEKFFFIYEFKPNG